MGTAVLLFDPMARHGPQARERESAPCHKTGGWGCTEDTPVFFAIFQITQNEVILILRAKPKEKEKKKCFGATNSMTST